MIIHRVIRVDLMRAAQ